MCQQFLEREAPLRRMPPVVQQVEVGVRRRPVDVAQRRLQRRHPRRGQHVRGDPVAQRPVGHLGQRERGELAHASLLHPLGHRVHRRQRFLDGARASGTDAPVLGVDDLEAGGTGPGLAVEPESRTAGERFLLGRREVEEAQCQ